MKRREFLTRVAAAPVAAASFTHILVGEPVQAAQTAQAPAPPKRVSIKQSVMAQVWGTPAPSLEERCKTLARIGFKAIDLPGERDIPTLKQYGLVPALMTGTGTSFQNGIIRKENHAAFETATKEGIDMCVRVGCPNLIALPGERRGMSREEGAENAVAYFNRVKGYAEEKGVTLCMEITNSKVVADARTDQVFDRLGWGIDVCKRANSPRVKIVYDIYHVQISDGDVTRNLRDNLNHICHIHVAGVPSRQEIDNTQELNYPFIANAIAESGYTGFVAHEYRPTMGRDPIKSLEQCFAIMNV